MGNQSIFANELGSDRLISGEGHLTRWLEVVGLS